MFEIRIFVTMPPCSSSKYNLKWRCSFSKCNNAENNFAVSKWKPIYILSFYAFQRLNRIKCENCINFDRFLYISFRVVTVCDNTAPSVGETK